MKVTNKASVVIYTYTNKQSNTFKQSIRLKCANPLCKAKQSVHSLVCPFCSRTCVKTSDLSTHLKEEHANNKGIFHCCGLITSESSVILEHIITNHLNHLPHDTPKTSTKKKIPSKNYIPKDDNDFSKYCVLDIGHGLDSEIVTYVPTETGVEATSVDLSESYKMNFGDQFELPQIANRHEEDMTSNSNGVYHPFTNQFEFELFMLIKVERISKVQYQKVVELFKLKTNENIPCYDTISDKAKNIPFQKPISPKNDNEYIYYSLEETVRNLFADPYISNKIYTKDSSETFQKEGEPFTTNGFKLISDALNKDVTPIVVAPYIDEYRKNRTGTCQVTGFYFTLYNFDSKFLTGSMESISVLGKCKNISGLFKMLKEFVQDYNLVEGKKIEIFHKGLNKNVRSQIVLGPWIWDSVQRWFTLFMSHFLCSRCDCCKQDYCQTPEELIETFNNFCNMYPHVNLKPYRHSKITPLPIEINDQTIETDLQTQVSCDEMEDECLEDEYLSENEIEEELEDVDYDTDEELQQLLDENQRTVKQASYIYSEIETIPKEKRKGFKLMTQQEIEYIDAHFSSKSINAKLSAHRKSKTLQKVENPLYKLRNYDIFINSLVDLMHAEIQGELRRHLQGILEYFSYPKMMADFQILINTCKLANGGKLRMKASNFGNFSADEFLEFVVYSVPIIHELLISSETRELQKHSETERKKHVVCWAEHVMWVCILLKNSLSDLDIQKSKGIFLIFRDHYTELFPYMCNNINFHWICHIFDDCMEWGSPRFFWALLFELKHKLFKQFNDGSNHKNVEVRGAEFEKLQAKLKAMYPWTRTNSKKWFKKLEEDQTVIFTKDGIKYIGTISEMSPQEVKLKGIKIIENVYHPLTQLRKLTTHTYQYSTETSWDNVLCRCQVVNIDHECYMNQFMLIMNYNKF